MNMREGEGRNRVGPPHPAQTYMCLPCLFFFPLINTQSDQLERVQKKACKIILAPTYKKELQILGLSFSPPTISINSVVLARASCAISDAYLSWLLFVIYSVNKCRTFFIYIFLVHSHLCILGYFT